MCDNQNNYILMLERIYSVFLAEDNFPNEDEDNLLRILSKTLNISERETLILASVVHEHHTGVTGMMEDLVRKLRFNKDPFALEKVEGMFRNLEHLGFLTFKRNDEYESYEISRPAYEALSKGEPFGKKLFADCYKELLRAEKSDFKNSEWRKRFYESVAESKDRRLFNAFEELGVRDWDEEQQKAFALLVWQFIHKFTAPLELSCNEDETNQALGALVTKGIAVVVLEESSDSESYGVVIAVKPVQLMFHGHREFLRYDEIAKRTDIILCKDIVEKQLFFPDESRKDIDNLRKLLSQEGFLRAVEIMTRQKRNPAIQSLFWGPPGTGKTEVVKQLARESGRDLVIFDAAKVNGKYLGESEKAYRSLFMGYSYLVAVSPLAPILLMNEADQALSKRLTNIEKSIDKCENTVSNIILQCFEDMSGILLATTNLVKNLDEAFDRRFLFKIHLGKPDVNTRKKIWTSFIPELTEDETCKLAEQFELSGAQISNVVSKRAIAEIFHDGDSGYAYIVSLCREEIIEPVKGASRKVGYK